MINHWALSSLDDLMASDAGLPEELLADFAKMAEVVASMDLYCFRNPKLEAISDELAACDTLDQLAHIMWDAATETGFKHATVFVINQGNVPAFKTRVSTSYPNKWLERYAEREYLFVDPIFERSSQSSEPFLFSDVPTRSPVVEAFWNDAVGHGIGRHGFCCVSNMDTGTRIGVSFGSGNSESVTARNVRTHGSDLRFLAQIAAETFFYLAQTSPDASQSLTVTELRFLHMLVTSDDPEAALAVNPAFGSNSALQASIRKKLGVKTILQAVSKASTNRWFDGLPFDVTDVSRAFNDLGGWSIVQAGEDEPESLESA